MDETRRETAGPGDESRREQEEWEQLQKEAAAINPYQYRRRGRLLAAVGLGALGAAVVWAVMTLTESARNPCQRVRDHYCETKPASPDCASYQLILEESVQDPSAEARGLVREQCTRKIRRLADEGVVVR